MSQRDVRHRRTQAESWGHFWPSVQLPDRHLNSFGWMSPTQPLPADTPAAGGGIGDIDYIAETLAPYIDAGLEHVLLVPLALSPDEWRHHVDELAGLIG